MNLQDVSSKIKQIINSLFTADKAKEILEKLQKTAENSSNKFWWLKVIALINVIIVELEDEDNELSGESKKEITEKILEPIWNEYVPAKITRVAFFSIDSFTRLSINLVAYKAASELAITLWSNTSPSIEIISILGNKHIF